jgi:DNA-binding transcriptional LysR family regulator
MVAPRPTQLDLDALRSFVTGIDLGSFARAAARLDRSPSAISLQLRKLETQLGQPLTRKSGRGLALTEAGEALVGPARRLLALNDEPLAALRGPALAGPVRLGLPQDFAETWLPTLLGRFARQHPSVQVEVLVDTNAALLAGLGAGRLDLVLAWEAGQSEIWPGPAPLARLDLPMAWIGPREGFVRVSDAPLPLVAFASPCLFRQAGLRALDAAAIPWRVAFTSPSLSGLRAAVAAGLGIALRVPHGLPPTLRVLEAAPANLPALPQIGLSLRASGARRSPALDRLADLLREAMAPTLFA